MSSYLQEYTQYSVEYTYNKTPIRFKNYIKVGLLKSSVKSGLSKIGLTNS